MRHRPFVCVCVNMYIGEEGRTLRQNGSHVLARDNWNVWHTLTGDLWSLCLCTHVCESKQQNWYTSTERPCRTRCSNPCLGVQFWLTKTRNVSVWLMFRCQVKLQTFLSLAFLSSNLQIYLSLFFLLLLGLFSAVKVSNNTDPNEPGFPLINNGLTYSDVLHVLIRIGEWRNARVIDPTKKLLHRTLTLCAWSLGVLPVSSLILIHQSL